MSINKFTKIFDNATACVDRQGEYLGTNNYDRKFDQIEQTKIIIEDQDYYLHLQIFVADVKVFDVCISGDEFELFVYREGSWQEAIAEFAKTYPPRNPSTVSDLSNLYFVDYR